MRASADGRRAQREPRLHHRRRPRRLRRHQHAALAIDDGGDPIESEGDADVFAGAGDVDGGVLDFDADDAGDDVVGDGPVSAGLSHLVYAVDR
jgi:hypothetical protein